jgi:hypothetical protein
LKTGTRFLGSKGFQFKFTGAAGFGKFLAQTRVEGSSLHQGLFEKLVNVGGFFFMPLVYRCGYGFADLLYDFAGDFLVFYPKFPVVYLTYQGKTFILNGGLNITLDHTAIIACSIKK